MKAPCEIIVTKILPSIRAALVKTLVNEHKMKQVEVAGLLGITQASVSQYMTSARGADNQILAMFPELEQYGSDMAATLTQQEASDIQIRDLCRACRDLRERKAFCDYHRQVARLDDCNICQEIWDDPEKG
ncbi:MAG: transcriptional regulator [Candidatus Heimdallarchaeota archaeon]